jgi:hypothetical protein
MKLKDLLDKLSNPKVYRAVLIIATICFCKELLVVSKIEPVWQGYWDTSDYRVQSESSLLSSDFYCPEPRKWFFPRPFTMPLMYKFVDSDIYQMVLFQKFIYCLSVFALILCLNLFITNYLLKTLSSLFLLFFFTWWNIVGWSANPLSESISISFMLVWFAAILWYYYKSTWLSVTALMLSSLLLSFTRDNWPYAILLFFISNLALNLWLKTKRIKADAFFVLFSSVVFLFQSYTMKVGERNVIPIFNSIAVRITQNTEYLDWFEKEGMPTRNTLVKNFTGVLTETNKGVEAVYKAYGDSSFIKLFEWIKKDGKAAYQKFILTHPSYFFLQDQTKEEVDRLFAYNVYKYYPKPRGFFANADNFFPIFNNYISVLLLLICTYIYYRSKKVIYLTPFILGTITLINALIVYNADALEVKRHMINTVICRELLSIISVFFVINYFIELNKKRAEVKLNS